MQLRVPQNYNMESKTETSCTVKQMIFYQPLITLVKKKKKHVLGKLTISKKVITAKTKKLKYEYFTKLMYFTHFHFNIFTR